MKLPALFLLFLSCLPLAARETQHLTAQPEMFWSATDSRIEAAEADGKPVIRWHLETGKLGLLSLKTDSPLFSRLRYFDRLEYRFRIAQGQADFIDFRAMGHVSGARESKIHQWQTAIVTTPLYQWHPRQVDFNRPNWFPWDDPDGNTPHFRFHAVGLAPGTVVEIADLRLISNPLRIKPFFEYPITWPIRTDQADGGIVYELKIPVANAIGKPSQLVGKIISKHDHFELSIDPPSAEVANNKEGLFTITARMSKAAIAATPPFYTELAQIAFHHADSPETISTFELPLTRPLDSGYRKQMILSPEDLDFIRAKVQAQDAEALKAIEFERIVKDADAFLSKRLAHIPWGHLGGRVNYWPTVPGTKTRYELGDFMPEIVNPITGEREVGTPMANRVWKEYLGQMGRVTETLGYAYLFTGEEKYAEKAVELLELWAKQYHELHWENMQEPSWNHGPAILAASRIAPNSSYGSNWMMRYTMRMLGMISESPSLTPEARERIYNGFILPYATEIAKFPGGISNMTDITNHNLLIMGLVFEDANLVRWALLTDPGLLRRLNDLDEDGFSSEGRPTNYHVAAMQEYLPSIAYLRNSGLKLDIPTERLLAAVRMLYQRATLWGVTPNSGDCGRGSIIGRLPLADELVGIFPQEPWLLDIGRGATMSARVRRLATQRPIVADGFRSLLETKPRLYRNAGLAILRTGDTPETQIMATLDYGRNPMHGHLDRNQITLAAFGKVFTHGPGTLYNAGRGGIVLTEDKQLASFCGANSIGQNVILVDAQNQQVAVGELLHWSEQEGHQYATARVPAIAPGVDHTRTLILRDGLVILLDEVTSKETHQYDFAYHNLGTLTPGPGWTGTPQGQPLATTANYANIRDLQRLTGQGALHLLWDLSQERPPNAKGEPTPVHLALWQLPHAGGEVYTGITGMNNPNTTKMPDGAPSLFHRVQAKSARFVTVLEPYKQTATVTGIEGDASGLTIHRGGKKLTMRYADYAGKN